MSSVDVSVGRTSADQVSDSLRDVALKLLAARFHQGEVAALEQVLRDFGPPIRHCLRQKYGGLLAEDQAEHVTLTAIYRGWERHTDFHPDKGSLYAWISTIADHAAADFCDSPQGRGRLLEIALDPNRLAALRDRGAPDPNAPTCHTRVEELRELARQALNAIPEEYRKVLLAFACAAEGELSSAKLAAEEGVTASAIRMRRKRAYAFLEEELRRLDVDGEIFCDTQTVSISNGAKDR